MMVFLASGTTITVVIHHLYFKIPVRNECRKSIKQSFYLASPLSEKNWKLQINLHIDFCRNSCSQGNETECLNVVLEHISCVLIYFLFC